MTVSLMTGGGRVGVEEAGHAAIHCLFSQLLTHALQLQAERMTVVAACNNGQLGDIHRIMCDCLATPAACCSYMSFLFFGSSPAIINGLLVLFKVT